MSASQQVQLIGLSPDLLVEVLSFISHASRRLAGFCNVCKSLQATLDEDSAWRHLCKRYWYATDDRLKQWPSLSSRGLYLILERWTPWEGYYVLSPAFPWGMLVLLRLVDGHVAADVIRFVPRDDGGFAEVQVSLFRVTFSEDRPGVVRSTISGSCWGKAAVDISDLDPQELVARTECARLFKEHIVSAGLFSTRRALRLQALQSPEVPEAGGDTKSETPRTPLAGSLQATPGSFSTSEQPEFCRTDAWQAGVLLTNEEAAKGKTEMMLQDMFSTCKFPCDLALLRGPDDFVPHDPGVPRIRPGLYVGDYGNHQYGQFRTEVLLLEYISLTAAELVAESTSPTRVFARPNRAGAPLELAKLVQLQSEVTFMRGVKQCGDFHVSMGATTFVAVCGPSTACSILVDEFGQCPSTVRNRQTHQIEDVRRSWRGWGTLAMPGFRNPSWAGGWLVQLGDDGNSGDHRFGFVWDRNQDSVVLHWIIQQDTSPFLQRAWLPEDVR